ncbi:Chitinase domain-containing protein 1 [Chytriomyces hyalinus]|nr:Chitinase domain-containing protein 1 [Chytriomyces hyalinus]
MRITLLALLAAKTLAHVSVASRALSLSVHSTTAAILLLSYAQSIAAEKDDYFDDEDDEDDPFAEMEREMDASHHEDIGDSHLVIDLDPSEVVKNHERYDQKNAHTRGLDTPVLAYITPWNNHGYDVAKFFRGKFTHLSPVWYHVKPNGRAVGQFDLSGAHDVDQGWIKEVTAPVETANGETMTPKMVPRFIIEGFAKDDLIALSEQKEHGDAIAKMIVAECKKQKHDGFVLEFVYSAYTPLFVSALSRAAKKAELQFFLVIPPSHPAIQNTLFGPEHFNAYKNLVDGFSLMTYDYSTFENPGPNSPLPWVIKNVLRLCPDATKDRSKILVGLNMYGNNYSPEEGHATVLGRDYVKALALLEPAIVWDDKFAEHRFSYKTQSGARHDVWYPSVTSIQARVEVIRELGAGVSLWEIGQGLDYFYDLF